MSPPPEDNKKDSENKQENLVSRDEQERILEGGTKALSGCLRFFLIGIFMVIVAYFLFLIFRHHSN
jgi:hypothetical protein